MKKKYSINKCHLNLPCLRLFLLFLLLYNHAELKAQSNSNIKQQTYSSPNDTMLLDTFSIVPNSLVIKDGNDEVVAATDYDFYPFLAKLIWKKRPIYPISVQFRSYSIQLANRYYKKDFEQYTATRDQFNIRPLTFSASKEPDDFIDFGQIEYAGNFSRGLSFGSNQDVVLNSVLNLQLQGKISKDLEVIANVTDNNIPIQPDGNTQQLQEFDKIFIQLRKGQQSITVGDFDLLESSGYFLRYSKKAQGARIDGIANLKKAGSLKINAGGGVSRGKFARNTLPIREGNQGPYKLLGSNGESFIIVLANTEEVFINGVKQTRGFDKDYVIDYNTGQITFTPRRLITRDLRVIVEFEYAERSYQRSLVETSLEYQYQKTKIGFQLYSEQDSKNQNLQQTLNNEKKKFLATIGDSTDKAFYTGVDSVQYDDNRILYKRVDTLVFINGLPTNLTFYEYSNDPLLAKYSLSFSLVGSGNGNYSSAANTANGRVYQYEFPEYDANTGKLIFKGSYEPVIKLITPAYNQVYALRIQQGIGKNLTANVEGSLSNRDLNMYSTLNDNDNIGGAAFASINFDKDLKSTPEKSSKITAKAEYEFVNSRFYPIERYRNVEFFRDFNLNTTKSVNDEHITRFGIAYQKGNALQLEYRLRTYFQQNLYTGFEHFAGVKSSLKSWDIRLGSSFLHAKSTTTNTLFARPNGEIIFRPKHFKGWKTGVTINNEFLRTQNFGDDTLDQSRSHIWQEYRVYFQSHDTAKNQYRVEYFIRTEQPSFKATFGPASKIGHNVSFTGNINTIKNQSLHWSLTYRRVYEKDSLKAAQELENYYLGRIDYNFNILKGFLKSTTFYQLGTGQQAKLQLIYVVSPTNKGDYIWQGDVNGNRLKDITEFVPLKFQTDTSYIRTFQYTADLVPVSEVEFNEALNINPAALLNKNSSKAAKAISLFSIFASVQLTKKIYTARSNKAYEYFLPVSLKSNDTSIVQQTINSKNSLFFNRFSSKINAQFDFNYLESNTLLTSGIEKRLNSTQSATIRWNIWRELLLQTVLTTGIKSNESDFYLSQQFKIRLYEASADLSYLYRNKFRVGISYAYLNRANNLAVFGGQKATQQQVGANFRYSKSAITTLNAKFVYTLVKYTNNNNPNPQAEFTILEGLKNGSNYVWNVSIEQKITSLLQLIIGYDGRKTGIDKPVHSGRAEIRALF